MTIVRHKPYELTTYDGNTVDWMTRAALMEADDRYGETFNVVQGSYSGGVDASAGTHDGGGAVDIYTDKPGKVVRALADVGFAAWHRPYNWDGRGGSEHVHAVLKSNRKASDLARAQADWYDRGRDGLGSSHTSPPFGVNHGYVPETPVEFDYAAWQRERILNVKLTRLMRKRERITGDIKEIRADLRKLKH